MKLEVNEREGKLLVKKEKSFVNWHRLSFSHWREGGGERENDHWPPLLNQRTYLLLELRPLLVVEMPVLQLLLLYKLGTLGVGQLSPEELRLEETEEMETLGIPVEEVRGQTF